MIENPPQPMGWDEYEQRLSQGWNYLLDSDPSEKEVQAFLEKHPCLIPGASKMSGLKSGHYSFPNAVISQPRLQGIEVRQPDFMCLSTNSLEFEPVLIEIERPGKRWFNSSGDPSADFTQAHNQLAQWKAWFGHEANRLVFYDSFGIPAYLRQRKLKIAYVLIYGRRSEYEGNESLNRVRAELAREGEYLMSYNRLNPISDGRNLFTVKKTNCGYKAIAYPPTYVLGPNFAKLYSMITDKNEALDVSEWMSQERVEFLKSRFPYWEEWGQKVRDNIIGGTMFSGDVE